MNVGSSARTVPWQQDIEELGDDHVFEHTSRATLLTNPFRPLSPLIDEEVGVGGPKISEQWVWSVRCCRAVSQSSPRIQLGKLLFYH